MKHPFNYLGLLSLPALETVSLPASMAPAAQALGETPFQIQIF